jgi:putative membrane protein
MLCRVSLSAALALLVFPFASADDKKDNKPFSDEEFVQKAACGGLHEVALGKLATEKAKDPAVKQFGQMMVTDHTKANEALKMAAKAAGLTVPDKMDDEHQKECDRFKKLSGDQFDREYTKHMVKDHEEDVAEFTRASKEAKNPAIKEFAAKTLPTLQKHLEAAKKLNRE